MRGTTKQGAIVAGDRDATGHRKRQDLWAGVGQAMIAKAG
jgi:hypothetical protein